MTTIDGRPSVLPKILKQSDEVADNSTTESDNLQGAEQHSNYGVASGKGGSTSSTGDAVSLFKNVQLAQTSDGEGFVSNDDGSYTFRGTSGDDRYVMTGDSGVLTITNLDSDEAFSLSQEEVDQGLTIDLGDGDDNFKVEYSGRSRMTINGGSGEDTIDTKDSTKATTINGGDDADTIIAGNGPNIVFGGAGDDQITTGLGSDKVYGGDGDDTIDAGSGHDLIMGGAGADAIAGGAGGDAIYADAADTAIDAGAGDGGATDGNVDVVIAEEGAPAVANLEPDEDVALTYNREEVDAFLEANPVFDIEGREDFVERTKADFGVMLNTEQGQGLLGALSGALTEKGETIKIIESDDARAHYKFDQNLTDIPMLSAEYDSGAPKMPLMVMFHELVHGHQDLIDGIPPPGTTEYENGVTITNREAEAVGLPHYATTGEYRDENYYPYSDNKFRAEIGVPLLQSYNGESGPPVKK